MTKDSVSSLLRSLKNPRHAIGLIVVVIIAMAVFSFGEYLKNRFDNQNRANALNKNGNALLQEGNATEALKKYQEALAIRKKIVEDDPDNMQWKYDLAVSYGNIGKVLSQQGHSAEALTAYESALNIGMGIVEKSAEYQAAAIADDN